MKKSDLIKVGFKKTLRSDGANVLSFKLSGNAFFETWGNLENGEVTGLSHVVGGKYRDSINIA